MALESGAEASLRCHVFVQQPLDGARHSLLNRHSVAPVRL